MRRFAHRWGTGAAALLICGLLGLTAGCGGGAKAGTDGVQRLSVEDYNAKVKADMSKAMNAKPGK